jgi:hypothetical protein
VPVPADRNDPWGGEHQPERQRGPQIGGHHLGRPRIRRARTDLQRAPRSRAATICARFGSPACYGWVGFGRTRRSAGPVAVALVRGLPRGLPLAREPVWGADRHQPGEAGGGQPITAAEGAAPR